MISRRDILRSFAAGSAAIGLSPRLFAAIKESRYLETIGLQLYTVRHEMQKDKEATLRAVADAGYKQVETGDPLQNGDIVKIARDLGMRVTSSFINWTTLGNPEAKDAPEFEDVLDKAKALELKHLVFGYIGKGCRETIDQYKGHAERANKAGEACRDAGIKLCYHNHSFEFAELADGVSGYDVLISELDPNLVPFELDVFWAKLGGWDPMETMRKLKGRISQVHLKDLKADTPIFHDEGQVPKDAFKELGNGTIDMREVLRLADECGVEQCHVEQDQSPNPLQSVRQSMEHLLAME